MLAITEDMQHAWENWGSGARDNDDPRKIMVSDLIGSCGHLRPNFPRSRHLPSASIEGSIVRNLNRIGVRLWT